MLALGLTVDLPSRGRPALRAVLLGDNHPQSATPTLPDISLVGTFDVPTIEEDWATQLKDIAEAVTARMQTLRPDIVVVRRADQGRQASNGDGPRIRLLATGAVTAAARILVPRTTLRTGKECGSAYGGSKEDVDGAAQTLVSAARQVPAAAAAIAGLFADRG